MKQLEIISKRIATMAKEVIDGKEIVYNYDTTSDNTAPNYVSFSTFGSDEKTINGSYSKDGEFILNGDNITSVEDLKVVQAIFNTELLITTGKIKEVDNEVETEEEG